MHDFLKKHTLIAVLASYAAYLVFGSLVGLLLKAFNITFPDSNAGYFVREIVVKVIPSVLMALLIGTLDSFKNPFKNLGRSLLSGGWIIFLGIMGTWLILSEAVKEGNTLKGVGDVIFYVLFLMMVGLSEELLMRGTITRFLGDRFGREGKGMWITVLLGAVIFGAYHFANYFSGQPLRATLLQVLGTTMLGMLLCAVYVKWGNLLGVIILHATLDFMAISENALIEGVSISSAHSGDGGDIKNVLLSNGTFVIAAIIVMLHRKKKVRKNEENGQRSV